MIEFLREPSVFSILQNINNIWLFLAGWVLGLMYIPQIIQLYKTKDYKVVDIKSIAPLTFAILGFTMNGLVIYIMTGTLGTFTSQLKSLVPLLLMYIMYFYYKSQYKKNYKEEETLINTVIKNILND